MTNTRHFRAWLAGILATAALAPAALAGGHGAPAPTMGTPFADIPNARPGECYARILVPAQYETITQQVVTQEGYDRLIPQDAQFAPRDETVLTKDPAVRYRVSEPVYQTVREEILVRPGYERLVVEPAQYDHVTEEIMVRPPRMAWQPGGSVAGAPTRVDPHSGAVYCLVEIPGETKTVTRRVLVKPETTRAVAVPPQFATFERQVLVEPARIEEVPIPAEHRTITVNDLVRQPQVDRIAVPAQTSTVQTKRLVAEERYEWVSVLCDVNATAATIHEMQTALKTRGYYAGPIDGILGPQTYEAIRRFQMDEGIPHGGYLSMETIDRLRGVSSARSEPSLRGGPQASHAPAHAPTSFHHSQPHASSHHGGLDVGAAMGGGTTMSADGFGGGVGAAPAPGVRVDRVNRASSRALPRRAPTASDSWEMEVWRPGVIVQGGTSGGPVLAADGSRPAPGARVLDWPGKQ